MRAVAKGAPPCFRRACRSQSMFSRAADTRRKERLAMPICGRPEWCTAGALCTCHAPGQRMLNDERRCGGGSQWAH
jgi:hypothetical protein